MSRRHAAILFGTASLFATAYGSPVVAQSEQPAMAPEASALEEIVVTARRREERVQTIPMAITAFSQSDIEAKHIQQVSDLARNVPSLNVSASQSDSNSAYSSNTRLRGLAGTIVYFADVPLGTTDFNTGSNRFPRAASPGFYYDLDNAEVLKGPQGTLFGRNSIGGLISIEPKKPENNFDGYLKATFGNYGDREFEGAINLPIIGDKLLLRVAGQSQQRDGYTKDISNGKDYDNRDYYAWRVGVIFRPTDDIENYFLYDGYYQHANGSATIPTYLNSHFLGGILLDFFPSLSGVIEQQRTLGVREVLGRATPGIGKDYNYGFTNTTSWDLADDLTLKNIAGARIFKILSSTDLFGGPVPILTIGDPINNRGWNDNTAQYSDEIQLQGKSIGDRLTWVVGGFLEFDHPLGFSNMVQDAFGGAQEQFYYPHNSDRSQALFAHGVYDLSDYVTGLRFTAGYRYTWDFVSVQQLSTLNSPTVIRNASGVATNCGGFGSDSNCYVASDGNFSSFGWNLGLDEQLDSATLIYVRAGNAYRPGTTNSNVPAPYQSLKPEHVTDVELGAKVDWQLFGAKLRTNADIFHTDYKAIQVSQLVSTSIGPETLETNAASAFLEGGELEAVVVPVAGIEISPHISYLYTHYNQYPTVLGGGAGFAPPFSFTPKWQYGVVGTYHLPLDSSVGGVAFSLNYSWTGHQYDDGSVGEIYPIIPSYDQLDIRVDWTDVFETEADLAFFMTNALDSTHVTGVFPLYDVAGFTSLTYNEPRMFGFSLKYHFGGESEPETARAAYAPPSVVTPAPAVPNSYLVFFDFNKSDLTPQAVSIVNQAAANAGPAKITQLTVTGHTDTVGSDAYNMRLSRRRAESVAAQLEKDGIASSEIQILAKGKRDLLVPTSDGVKEPQNRRVQIVYSGGSTS